MVVRATLGAISLQMATKQTMTMAHHDDVSVFYPHLKWYN